MGLKFQVISRPSRVPGVPSSAGVGRTVAFFENLDDKRERERAREFRRPAGNFGGVESGELSAARKLSCFQVRVGGATGDNASPN